jgi:hypothetical protein
MVNVPSQADRKQRYLNSLGGVPGAYKAGIEQTQGWKEKAIAGQGLYEQRMQDSNVLRRRERALQRTSEADWKAKAAALGSMRIADGMRQGADKQAANYEPIAAALRNLTLPERSADPMANIDNRVKAVVRTAIEASPKNQ